MELSTQWEFWTHVIDEALQVAAQTFYISCPTIKLQHIIIIFHNQFNAFVFSVTLFVLKWTDTCVTLICNEVLVKESLIYPED